MAKLIQKIGVPLMGLAALVATSCGSGVPKYPVDNKPDTEDVDNYIDEESDTYTDDVTDDYVDNDSVEENPDLDILCEEGDVRYVSCGLNGNGEQEEECGDDGNWYINGDCVDSDVCKNGESQDVKAWNTVAEKCDICGLAKCVEGQWKNPSADGLMDHCEYRTEDGPEGLPNGFDDDCNGIVDDNYFIIIPAGEFLQTYDNFPVTLEEFKIMKYEITRGQWQECIKAGVCASIDDITAEGELERPDHPVNNLNAASVKQFCRNYVGNGQTDDEGNFVVDVPTYSQWEKAAAGPDGDRFAWGDYVPSSNHETKNCELMNYLYCYNDEENGVSTVPVNYFNGENPMCRFNVNNLELECSDTEKVEDIKSVYGVYGMNGNVSEFVKSTELDPYDDSDFRAKGGSFMSTTQVDCTTFGGSSGLPDNKCRGPPKDEFDKHVANGGRCVYNNK
jgi:hypothetical protein